MNSQSINTHFETTNRKHARHSIFHALVDNGLYHGIIENKKALADVTTFEAWKNRQVLLQLPADEREHLELPPPNPDWPLGASKCPWRC